MAKKLFLLALRLGVIAGALSLVAIMQTNGEDADKVAFDPQYEEVPPGTTEVTTTETWLRKDHGNVERIEKVEKDVQYRDADDI